MVEKKQKTIFDKFDNVKREGIIKLNSKDRKAFGEGFDKLIEKESEKKDNYAWFLVGIGIGILGNFIVNLFYDWIKSLGGWKFGLMSILIIVLFFMIIYFLFLQFKEYKEGIDFSYHARKMFTNAKSLKVGKPLKVYDKDRFNGGKQ